MCMGVHRMQNSLRAYKRYGTSPIGWNSIDKLGGMIEGKVEPAELPDGTPSLDGIYPMIYIKCR